MKTQIHIICVVTRICVDPSVTKESVEYSAPTRTSTTKLNSVPTTSSQNPNYSQSIPSSNHHSQAATNSAQNLLEGRFPSNLKIVHGARNSSKKEGNKCRKDLVQHFGIYSDVLYYRRSVSIWIDARWYPRLAVIMSELEYRQQCGHVHPYFPPIKSNASVRRKWTGPGTCWRSKQTRSVLSSFQVASSSRLVPILNPKHNKPS